ncbi:hypothetical protein [Nocardia donostiensis]|uniref:hypothetical protein n=1 Tax=Nocardia donostiensis TaxID=1538463 RepID=UPI00158B1261|nr:hypothetical protein [Nocardia donostiensis]
MILLDTQFEIEEIREFRLDAHAAEYRFHNLHRDGFLRLEHVLLGDITFRDLTR